jgi:hypothetical protein
MKGFLTFYNRTYTAFKNMFFSEKMLLWLKYIKYFF